MKHQFAHRSRREAAIVEELVEGLIATYDLVTTVGLDQTPEGLIRESAGRDGALQAAHHRMLRMTSVVDPIEIPLEPVEQTGAITEGFVTEVVDQACEAVDGQQVSSLPAAEQTGCHREVLAARLGHHRGLRRGRGSQIR